MPEPILQKANELENLTKRYAELRQQKGILDGFKTRRDKLRELAKSVGALVQAQKLLASSGVRIRNNGVDLAGFQDKVSEVTVRFVKNPNSILQPRAVDLNQFQNTITAISNSLIASWKSYTAPGVQGEALVNVLDRYPPFRETAGRIRRLRQQLLQKAQELPSSEQDVRAVTDLKYQLAAEIRSLSGKGLDEEVLDFLRRSARGVPLSKLLSNPKVLKWLQEEDLIGCFEIKCL